MYFAEFARPLSPSGSGEIDAVLVKNQDEHTPRGVFAALTVTSSGGVFGRMHVTEPPREGEDTRRIETTYRNAHAWARALVAACEDAGANAKDLTIVV